MQPVVHDFARSDGARAHGAIVWLHGVSTHRAATHGRIEERTAAVNEDHIARVNGIEIRHGHGEPTEGHADHRAATNATGPNERSAGLSRYARAENARRASLRSAR